MFITNHSSNDHHQNKSYDYDKFVSFYHFPSYPTKQIKHVWKPQLSIYTNHMSAVVYTSTFHRPIH